MPRYGQLGMQERVALLGGTLAIESSPQAGTAIFVEIPLAAAEAAPAEALAGVVPSSSITADPG